MSFVSIAIYAFFFLLACIELTAIVLPLLEELGWFAYLRPGVIRATVGQAVVRSPLLESQNDGLFAIEDHSNCIVFTSDEFLWLRLSSGSWKIAHWSGGDKSEVAKSLDFPPHLSAYLCI